jgi:hypothetical protein
MRYEFRTADGRTCCRTDRIDMLCPRCRPKATEVDRQPPDAYAVALAARGCVSRSLKELGADYNPYGTPPDPYAMALAARKEQRR